MTTTTPTVLIEADPERRAQQARALESAGFEVRPAADLTGAYIEALAPEERRPNARRGRPTLAELDRRYAAEILRQTGGNKTRAAEILGIDRKTLYRLIEPPQVAAPPSDAAVSGSTQAGGDPGEQAVAAEPVPHA